MEIFVVIYMGRRSNQRPPTGDSSIPVVSIFSGKMVLLFKVKLKFFSIRLSAILAWIIANLIPKSGTCNTT